jgi:hypothetical protein
MATAQRQGLAQKIASAIFLRGGHSCGFLRDILQFIELNQILQIS